MKYVDDYAPPVVAGPAIGTEPASDNSLLFGILTLILALVAFILLQVNSSLKKLTDEKEGVLRGEPIPFYRNKTYLMTGILLLFGMGGYYTINGAVGLGRSKNYQPEQPIYYSHKRDISLNRLKML